MWLQKTGQSFQILGNMVSYTNKLDINHKLNSFIKITLFVNVTFKPKNSSLNPDWDYIMY